MNAADWKGELDRLLKVFEVESTISLKKIKRYFMASEHQFNEDFRKYFLKLSSLRLDASFDAVLLDELTEAISADNQINIGQTNNTDDDEHQVNPVIDVIESETETNNENADEVCVKLEAKVENEFEDDVQLPYDVFDPNKADESASESAEEDVAATAVSSIQSQTSSSSPNAQKGSKHIAVKSFKCNDCQYVTSYKSSLKRHQLIHRGEITKTFKCKRCNFSCRHKNSLDRHKHIHTRQESMGVVQDQNDLFKCTQCDLRFTMWHSLKTHLTRSHKSNQRLFNCVRCMRRFSRKLERDRHEIRCQHRHYECHLCQYGTPIKNHMQQHMRTHTGAKPFECAICLKYFRLKSTLKCHLDSIHRCK